MKKWFCFVLSFVLLVALVAGCAPAVPETSGTTAPTTIPTQPTDPAPTDPTNPTDPSEPAEPEEIAFTYQDISTQACFENACQEPHLYVIRSVTELETYCAENERHLSRGGFTDAIVNYDEAYFADNTLLIIAVESSAIAPLYEVSGIIRYPDGSWTVNFVVTWEDKDYSMAYCANHFLIEVSGSIPQDTPVTLETTNINLIN